MSFLTLDRLTKRFGDHLAVDGVSFDVGQGEFLALLGPSGCGKTTTLQMIAGFADPTSGAILLSGQDLTALKPAQRDLGIVFQSYALFPHMTAAENVAFGLEMRNIARAECARRVTDALALVGLAGFADRFPRRMSGGQQQRVALARALVVKPRILLLDEPLSNLDAKLREEMQIELRQIQRTTGTTTILVTHDQGEAMALADRLVVMNAGRVEQIGSPHETYERPATPFVASFLGKTNVLSAVVGSDHRAAIGAASWPVPPGSPQDVLLSIRPEKIDFAASDASAVPGTIKTRIFQGNHWLYQVDTPAGLVTVVRQNAGESIPAEGELVALTWRAEDMSVRPAGGGRP